MRTLTCGVLVGTGMVVAGCGGLPREELTDKADAICARYSKQGAALGSPDLNDPVKAKAYFTKAASLAGKQQDELSELEPDDGVKADFAKLTKATGAATTLLSDLADASGSQDSRRYASLVQKLGSISDDVDASAAKVGADKCAG